MTKENIVFIIDYFLEFLKIICVWPVFIFFICLIFKKNIVKFIDDIMEVSLGDKKIKTQRQKQISASDDFNEEFKKIEKESPKKPAPNIDYYYASVYRLIFKSQIFLLKDLEKHAETGLSIRMARATYYPIEISPAKLQSYTFNSFIGYLLSCGFITVSDYSMSDDTAIKITGWGKNFLGYIEQNKLPWITKPL